MSREPLLWDETKHVAINLAGRDGFLVGRTETADWPVTDPACSRRHFQIVSRGEQYLVEPLSLTAPTFCDGRELREITPLSHGSMVQAGVSRFRFLWTETGHELTDLPFESHTICLSHAIPSIVQEEAVKPLHGPMSLPEGMTLSIGRDASQCSFELPHPLVSRRHAEIARHGTAATLRDLDSANGVYVNGRQIEREAELQCGDRVEIGPYVLRFDGHSLTTATSRQNNIELAAVNLRREVLNPNTGLPVVLLDDISVCVHPREFTCILGAAGAGKSTLLQALSGRVPADFGQVLINQRDLYASFEQLKHDLAVVPQRDCVHELLTVEQALWYTAKLRLPADTSDEEIHARIQSLLKIIGLTDRAQNRIRDLSGGQRKRAVLGNEIIAEPSLLFLDEVTSGLDELTDREMMSLFREMAERGKTVVCITHTLANVESSCHLLVVLAQGGTLAFIGSPAEALVYFGISRLSEVYDLLATKPASDWKQNFRESEFYDRYVTQRLADSSVVANFDPESKPRVRNSDHSVVVRIAERLDVLAESLPAALEQRVKPFIRRLAEADSALVEQGLHQTYWLSGRQYRLLLADKATLTMWVVQCLTVAFLLISVFGDVRDSDPQTGKVPTLLFFLAISSYWFGCNNSAKQIVHERVILERERAVGLSPCGYWISKFGLLGLSTMTQTLGLFVLVTMGCHVPGSGLLQVCLLCGLALAGVAIGLAISTLATTEEAAISWVPVILIPQILLAGLIAPLEGWNETFAKAVVTSYWGQRSLLASLPDYLDASTEIVGGAVMILLHLMLGGVVAILTLRGQSSGKIRRA